MGRFASYFSPSAVSAAIATAAWLALSAPAGGARAAPAGQLAGCPQNQLVNPNMEEGFSPRARPQELVANGWEPWYETLPGVGGINYAPRYTPRRLGRDGPLAVLQGLWAQELSTAEATHIGGLFQRVEVPPQSQILAHAFGRAWAGSGDATDVSDPPGLYTASLGVDPLGGANPDDARIQWTSPVTITAGWQMLQTELPVEGPGVTLFLRGQAARVLAHHVAHWDAACLRVLGPVGQPTASPTFAPRPTRTPRPGEPTPSPGPGTREADAAVPLAELLAIASARAASPVAFRVTPADAPPAATLAPPQQETDGLRGALARNMGLVFLGLGALVGGLLLSAAKPSADSQGGGGTAGPDV